MRAAREVTFRKMMALCVAAAMGVLSACSAPSSYMGIDITNPAPAITLNEEQKAYFRERGGLVKKAQDADCFAKDPKAKDAPTLTDEQRAVCGGIVFELVALDARRPVFNIVQDLKQMQLSALAAKAQGGDKQAQLELGIRFEEGRGVPVDLKKARKLYSKAAADSGGTVMVYSPPVGNGTSGRVIPVNTGPKQVGLAEAKRRLEGLE